MVVQQGFSPADAGPGSGREPSFADKVRIFSHDLIKCCTYILSFANPQEGFTKKL